MDDIYTDIVWETNFFLWWIHSEILCSTIILHFNPLKTNGRLLYLKNQVVPRSKHFSSRLLKRVCLCCKWHKSLFVLR